MGPNNFVFIFSGNTDAPNQTQSRAALIQKGAFQKGDFVCFSVSLFVSKRKYY